MTNDITFFLVDDDEDDIMIFEEVAQDCAPQVQFKSAKNGIEALERLGLEDSTLPHLLFLDLNMPRMDGKECLSALKSDPRLASIPVLMYTTSSHLRDIEETMALGAIGLVCKPSDVKELKKILSTLAENCPHNLGNALRYLSTRSNTLIAC